MSLSKDIFGYSAAGFLVITMLPQSVYTFGIFK